MKSIKPLTALAVILIFNSCASSKIEPLYFQDGIVNLSGMWVLVDKNNSEMDIMLDLAFIGDSLNMKIWGESVASQGVTRSKNQFLISYKTEDGQKFNILAQLEKNNQMRLSHTSQSIPEFMPIGQLGEKVYRLAKLKENRTYVTSTAGKQ